MRNFFELRWSPTVNTDYQNLVRVTRSYDKRQKYSRGLSEDVSPVGLLASSLPDDVVTALVAQLPKTVLALETPKVILVRMLPTPAKNPVLAPHIDIDRKAAINVYLKASGEVTKYYSWDADARVCSETGAFIAQSGSVWLLDSTVPHAVELIPNKERQILCFSFINSSFDEILAAFGD